MSDPTPLGEEGDRPIIIQGGGSVDISLSPNFKEEPGDSKYEQAGVESKDKKFKNLAVNLVEVQIDDGEPITLKKNSKITIKVTRS
ncbi:MAG: hypothetical protein QOD32_429 [Pyrinomonadaceae bacterium]|jgi:hypothetical protein|nr:hypothetical protein [Pyrinomonadaceae bacterium]